jgi:hypothetical protein
MKGKVGMVRRARKTGRGGREKRWEKKGENGRRGTVGKKRNSMQRSASLLQIITVLHVIALVIITKR